MRCIGFLTEMNRIESDRNGLNRADWIESETTKLDWLDWIGPNALYGPIELKQIFGLYRPCLEAIKSYIWGICLKSEYKSDYKCWLGIWRPQKVGLRHVWKLTGIWPEIGVTFENCQFWSEWFQIWHGGTWRVNLPLLKGPTLIYDLWGQKQVKNDLKKLTWNLTKNCQ